MASRQLEALTAYNAPFWGGFPITKSDSTVLKATRALWVGGVGDVAVRMLDGNNITFVAVPAGTKLDIQCDQVLSTGTSATNIIGLY